MFDAAIRSLEKEGYEFKMNQMKLTELTNLLRETKNQADRVLIRNNILEKLIPLLSTLVDKLTTWYEGLQIETKTEASYISITIDGELICYVDFNSGIIPFDENQEKYNKYVAFYLTDSDWMNGRTKDNWFNKPARIDKDTDFYRPLSKVKYIKH